MDGVTHPGAPGATERTATRAEQSANGKFEWNGMVAADYIDDEHDAYGAAAADPVAAVGASAGDAAAANAAAGGNDAGRRGLPGANPNPNPVPVTLSATAQVAGLRLDKALAVLLPHLSRGRIRSWIEAGAVTLNGAEARPRATVLDGDRIDLVEVPSAQEQAFRAEPMALEVVHADAAILVINKPAGLVVNQRGGLFDDGIRRLVTGAVPCSTACWPTIRRWGSCRALASSTVSMPIPLA